MPATLLNNSADRFWVLPGAIDAKLSLPGLALAAARMSPTVLSGPPALVAIRRSKKAVVVIGVKSRSTSNGSCLNSEVLMAVPLPVTCRV
jgi:hypothetical protein